MIIKTEIRCYHCGTNNLIVDVSSGESKNQLHCKECKKLLATNTCYSGFVYFLSNKSMPGLLKIGCTSRKVENRIIELSNFTGIPTPFEIEAYFPSFNHYNDEKLIHELLKEYKISGKEFFKISLDKAFELISKIINQTDLYNKEKTNQNVLFNQPKCFGKYHLNRDIPHKCNGCMFSQKCFGYELSEIRKKENNDRIEKLKKENEFMKTNNIPSCFGKHYSFRKLSSEGESCYQCRVRINCMEKTLSYSHNKKWQG